MMMMMMIMMMMKRTMKFSQMMKITNSVAIMVMM